MHRSGARYLSCPSASWCAHSSSSLRPGSSGPSMHKPVKLLRRADKRLSLSASETCFAALSGAVSYRPNKRQREEDTRKGKGKSKWSQPKGKGKNKSSPPWMAIPKVIRDKGGVAQLPSREALCFDFNIHGDGAKVQGRDLSSEAPVCQMLWTAPSEGSQRVTRGPQYRRLLGWPYRVPRCARPCKAIAKRSNILWMCKRSCCAQQQCCIQSRPAYDCLQFRQ